MANAFLIVGVGGAGRGVCNHIKYELEQDLGELNSANTKVLVIDGKPAPSEYQLPGDPWFEIDTNPNSPEFCQTRDEANPAISIQSVAKGIKVPYISDWLTQDEAGKIPTNIKPTEGFGGHRTPGHAYFYQDINYINTALQKEYSDVRKMLGDDGGGQVLVCLVGSQSGGTGAGMLWDVAHLMRQTIAQNKDLLYIFSPLANSFHRIFNNKSKRDEVDAKNFAGLLNLIRFMSADPQFSTVIKYSDTFTINNSWIADVPFVLDGDVVNAQINNVVPQLGVVPAIADFLLTIIKDSLSTGAIGGPAAAWHTGIIGVAPKPEKYASFGTYSIRYPYKEVLKSFSYRFAYEIYNDILHPTGENFNKGQTEADRILTETTFTQMLSDFDAVKLNPQKDWKAMKGQIRVGKRGDAPAPPLKPLVEAIKHGGFLFWKTSDVTVIQNAEQYSGNVKTQFENWLKKQQPKISTAFLMDVEEELVAIFTKMEDGNQVPKTLQDDPSSIVVARDLLKHLKDKFIGFEKYLADKFNEYFYPEGQGQPDIIARQQAVVEEKRRIMEDDSGDVAETQEAYLKEASTLLEYEVWEILFKGIQVITTELKEGVLRLWNLIGDDANGWVNRLTEFLDRMDDEYDDDITRRNNLAEFRLREYLPTPDGAAEDALFDQIAEPEIQGLLAQMHWDFAINPEDPQRRYTILLRSPQVEGFEYQKTGKPLIDPQTGKAIASYWYTPYEHVFDARNKLAPLLESKTIWDIMALDFEHEWWPQRVTKIDATQRSQYEDQYVQEWVNKLITGSSPLLNSTQTAQTTQAFTFSQFQQATPPTDIATKFSATLRPRLLVNENMNSHPSFSKEIRRCIAYLRVPIASWNYYSTALRNYISYNQKPQRILIDIYPNEQNAFYVRELIVKTIDHNFTGLLDVSVTALLNELEVFQYFALDYVMGLIPQREGATRVAPKIFYVDLSTGREDLSAVWDIDELCLKINHKELNKDDKVLQVQDEIRKLWQDKENEAANANSLSDLLNEVQQRSQTFTFPNPPAGQTAKVNREHLKLAFQAIIKDYASRVRAAQGIT